MEIHQVIDDNLHLSAMYSGMIKGTGLDIVHQLRINLFALTINQDINFS